MSRLQGQEKPSLEDVAHFGVKGMKWGVRKKVSAQEIKRARKNFGRKLEDFQDKREELRKTTVRGSKARVAGEKRLSKVRMSLLNDPDRATALRMTKGEKWLAGVVAGVGVVGSGGAVAPVAAAAGIAVGVASRTVARKVIESKQRKRG